MSYFPSSLHLLTSLALASAASAQSFVDGATHIPQGPPFNADTSENIELVDIDLDGDFDAVWANGGAAGNEQNRLWLNLGGAQGGTPGFFADATATHLPSVLDSSRDIDFVDVEHDGDIDLFISNTSTIANQTNRWWINMGGAQGGVPGYFTDQTASRWLGIGVNNGVSACSSIASSVALAGGGFIDWCGDSSIADLDSDGDLDLVQSTYGALSSGKVPTRMFLNDGAGNYREFNPSCFQLNGTEIHPGDPGLWCQGVHTPATHDTTGAQCDVAMDVIAIEVGDLDNDFDVDLLHGNKFGPPRVFDNRLAAGQLAFRDVTYAIATQNWAPGPGNYDQELGDMDGDGDLDIYGVNWINLNDAQIFNRGDGTFDPGVFVPDSLPRQIEADLFDAENDGDLDALVISETIEERLYVNAGASGGYTLSLDAAAVPMLQASGQGADACDIDGDGDLDAFVATLSFEPNVLYLNTSQIADTFAPRVARLEQAADRAWGPMPTQVRAQVYDNTPWYRAASGEVELEFMLNGGAASSVPMRWSGGQVFRGEIPGALVGTVDYRVVARDANLNSGASAWLAYQSTPCTGVVQTYCTAKVNSVGCTPTIFSTGTPSATAPLPFRIKAANVINNKAGALVYGFGPAGAPFSGGFLCVQSPVHRVRVANSDGNPPPDDCSGFLSFDFNHYTRQGLDPTVVAGASVHAQYWYRDPASAHGSGLTDALSFDVCL